jgi:hypothetical protein
MRNKLFAIAILSSVLFFACKKKDSDSPAGPSKTTLLTQSSWQFNNAGLDPDKNGTIDQDISTLVNGCLKDNTVSFSSSNNSGTMDEGASKCNTNDPQTLPFTWAFTNSETKINITGNVIAGKGGEYKINSLTSTSFSLSKDTLISGFGQTTIVVNLKH